ncbi:hypothetical protein Esti_003255 [Eimeria stiedai]
MRLRTKLLGARLSQRRLARSEAGEDSDDEELGGILEDCLNMEQEYQITSGSGMLTDASPSVLPTFQPAVFLPRETVSVTGTMHGAAQTATSHHLGPRAEGESLAPLLATFDSLTSASHESVSFTPSCYSFSPEARLASISPTLAGEVEQAPPDDEQPSTSAAAGAELVATSAPSTDQQPAPLLHPFIRLPDVPPLFSVRPIDRDFIENTSQPSLFIQWTARYWCWSSFPSSFPTHSTVKRPGIRSRGSATFVYKLLKCLLDALEMYKTRTRPDLKEVVHLERMLVGSPQSAKFFKGFRWERWRQDDKMFRASNAKFSDDSEDDDEED